MNNLKTKPTYKNLTKLMFTEGNYDQYKAILI